MEGIAIFGSGGHASEIIDICYALGIKNIVLLLQTNETPSHDYVVKYQTEADIPKLKNAGYCFAIGVANGSLRRKIYKKYSDLHYPALIHPDASFGMGQRHIIENTNGAIVAAGARFMSYIQLGDFCIFGLNCTVGHESIIEDYVSVMPGANVSGNVHIKKFCYIGAGATILQGTYNEKLTLCESLVVGAGAVVTKSFHVASVVSGVPAVAKS